MSDQLHSMVSEVLRRVQRIEAVVVKQAAVKAAYTTAEFATLVRRNEYTVREWCRLGRVHATKRACGRGCSQEWSLSHDELVRYQTDGLLPLRV